MTTMTKSFLSCLPITLQEEILKAQNKPIRLITLKPQTTPMQLMTEYAGITAMLTVKGENRHDRKDFTHGGTEVAEDKKND